ncbi:MAG: hypothetical protein ACREU9_06760, partial [Gammaproteobacteria bacterium]
VFPWQWPLLFEVRQWLNSYLGYCRKASTHRLVARLHERHAWLAEYFDWQGWKVAFRCPAPRFPLRFNDQVRWFRACLPDHLLMIQRGIFWEVSMPRSNAERATPSGVPGADGMKILRGSAGGVFERDLWECGVPVAFIGETGRRVSHIAERALACRWSRGRRLT